MSKMKTSKFMGLLKSEQNIQGQIIIFVCLKELHTFLTKFITKTSFFLSYSSIMLVKVVCI